VDRRETVAAHAATEPAAVVQVVRKSVVCLHETHELLTDVESKKCKLRTERNDNHGFAGA
jgi:hypothetical protein